MGLFSTKTKTESKEKFDTGPSSWQKPFLDSAFGGAQKAYENAAGTPYYQGPTYAGMSDAQKASLDRMSAFAGGAAFDMGGQISSLGSQMVDRAGTKAMDNLDRFTSMAGEDATAANMAAASRYADNPYVSGMIDANARDINRNLYENEIPGIDRAAAGSGNINSSRAGVAAGIAQRGAADRIGDISAQIRGNAYSQGLSMAQADRAHTMDAYRSAADAYSGMTNTGISAMGTGTGMQFDALGRQADVQDRYQQDRQGEMDEAFQKWQGQDNREFDLLNRYYGIIGNNQWGQKGTSTTTGTSTQSGGLGNQLIAGAAAVGAAYAGKSDPRLKYNVRLVGRLEDGLGLYTWLYRQDLSDQYGLDLATGPQFGVMADEVEKLRPHALGPLTNGGFMTVNYHLL